MSKSVEELIEDLNDQDEFVVEAAAGELEMMGEESVDALISALSHRKKNIRLNVDGANAAILSDLGFDPKLGLGVFIIGRIPGIIAHIHEETIDEEEFRRFCDIDDIVYDGPGR